VSEMKTVTPHFRRYSAIVDRQDHGTSIGVAVISTGRQIELLHVREDPVPHAGPAGIRLSFRDIAADLRGLLQ